MLSKLKSFGLSGKLTGAGGGGFAFALVPPGYLCFVCLFVALVLIALVLPDCLCFVCCFVCLFVALVLIALVLPGCLCFVCLFVVLVLFVLVPPGCLPIFDNGLMDI